MAAVPIPAEHLAHMGQRYGEINKLNDTEWRAPLKQIEAEFAYNAPRDTERAWSTYRNFGDKDYGDDDAFKAAHFWCQELDSALREARLDHSAKRRAYNILSYLLHWDGANTIKHGFEARRREEVHLKEEQGKEHWRRLARMMTAVTPEVVVQAVKITNSGSAAEQASWLQHMNPFRALGSGHGYGQLTLRQQRIYAPRSRHDL